MEKKTARRVMLVSLMHVPEAMLPCGFQNLVMIWSEILFQLFVLLTEMDGWPN